ncbi:hypothetical protein PENPOL_c016G03989 [Penicillium polonicum]|uniref:Uncharacterized protein n=1 Tax=Penicillium polonicum TaxID=60169 RepID=A0A1V6NAE9_PENPO|nr:hypothetical protein PENPOL_c016G03989 [Penicillium polonicum]
MLPEQQPQESNHPPNQAPSEVPGGSNVTPGENESLLRDRQAPSSKRLVRSSFALWIAGSYATLSSFSWIAIVYLTFRPISSHNLSYSTDKDAGYKAAWKGLTLDKRDALFKENENWIQTARVLLSFVGVFSIPAASAVCASAAAVYSQRRARSRSADMTIRQVMMLADRNWTNPFTYARALTPDGWKHYGSWFLAVAIFVHILGFIIAPLQQIFLSSKTIKRSQLGGHIKELFDIPSHLANDPGYTNNTVVLATRDALERTSVVQPQTQLWPPGKEMCTSTYNDHCPDMTTFANISAYPDPFLAQLPNGYNTGLIRQYLPRINSTTTVTPTVFPKDCGDTLGSLYFYHENVFKSSGSDDYPWTVTACMPADTRQSPWSSTRDRQDFSEELYVNITYGGLSSTKESLGGYVVKITVNTTAGYFELPNYSNRGQAGPLLGKSPNCTDSNNCNTQYSDPRRIENPKGVYLDSHKGPLQTLTLALFGPDCFFEVWSRSKLPSQDTSSGSDPDVCLSMAPLGGLFLSEDGFLDMRNFTPQEYPASVQFPCGFNKAQTAENAIHQWLMVFRQVSIPRLENVFNAAAFLANQAWMEFGNEQISFGMNVYWDMGKDTSIPTFSVGGIVTVSILLGLYLFILIGLGYYSTRSPRWTEQLDSFAMMRIGASVADDVPLLAAAGSSHVAVLDKIPGIMGDSGPEDERIGKLALGGSAPLTGKRLYASYKWSL